LVLVENPFLGRWDPPRIAFATPGKLSTSARRISYDPCRVCGNTHGLAPDNRFLVAKRPMVLFVPLSFVLNYWFQRVPLFFFRPAESRGLAPPSGFVLQHSSLNPSIGRSSPLVNRFFFFRSANGFFFFLSSLGEQALSAGLIGSPPFEVSPPRTFGSSNHLFSFRPHKLVLGPSPQDLWSASRAWRIFLFLPSFSFDAFFLSP